MKKIALVTSLIFAFPFIASAQGATLGPVVILVSAIQGIVRTLIPLLIGVAVVVFFWGLVLYISGAGKDATKGKGIMIGGLIALFVMVSMWGIISMIQFSLGIGSTVLIGTPVAP